MIELKDKIKEAKRDNALSTIYDELREILNKNFSKAASIKEKNEKLIWLRDLISKIENDDPDWEKHLLKLNNDNV